MAFGGTNRRQRYNAKEKIVSQVATDLTDFYCYMTILRILSDSQKKKAKYKLFRM